MCKQNGPPYRQGSTILPFPDFPSLPPTPRSMIFHPCPCPFFICAIPPLTPLGPKCLKVLVCCWAGEKPISEPMVTQDDIIKCKHFPCYWPFVRGIHRSLVNSLHKGQWHGDLMFPLICAWTNGWVNNWNAGDLRRHHTHYDITVMRCMNATWYNQILLS